MESNEYYQPPQSAAQHKSTTAMGITSLVLGILAIVSSWMPIVNNFSALLALFGAIFGVIGIVGVVRGKKSGKAIAIAGIVLNVVAVVVVLATQSMYSVAIDEAMGASNSPSASSSAASAENGDAQKADSSSQSDYAVSIDSAVVTTDYDGNPALVVTYSWTNNSSEATSFAAQLLPKCFQNGVQLDSAFVVDGVDSNGYVNELKPGASSTVQLAYELADQSVVTVEVVPVINLNNAVLATCDFDVA